MTDAAPKGPARVRLAAMTPEEFRPYIERVITDYAADHVRGGRWTKEESLGASRNEVDRLLPQGVDTPHHHLFTIRSLPEGVVVGTIWVHVDGAKGFVYGLEIDEGHRRRGFARAAMLLAEEEARRGGAATLGLHVFGENAPARDLYRSLGYRETNVVMLKELRA